jgi:4-amino-4-deoxy-L-arabinose transferase-like glycosyltransferase
MVAIDRTRAGIASWRIVRAVETWPAAVIAAGIVALLLVVAGAYGFHRDELYFIVAGRHPSLGYVDQPPLTPLLSAAGTTLLGVTPVAVRILPAISAGIVMLLCADMAKRLGGGRVAQVVAAATIGSTGMLAVGHIGSTTTYDILAWTVISWLTIRLLDGGDRRLWILLGLAMGIGLENRYLVAFLGIGLAAGVVADRRWDVIRSPWAWASIVVAFAVWSPNLVWQVQNGWPQLEMAREIARKAVAERGTFLIELLIVGGLLLIFVPVVGFAWLLVARRARRWRTLAWASVVVVALVLYTNGKSYYVAGLLGPLVAAGATVLEPLLGRGRVRLRRSALGAVVVVSFTLMAFITLPLVPAPSLRSTPIPELYGEAGEQVGWDDLASTVERVVRDLPAVDRADAVILTANYGEAAALELLGTDLPPVYSGHNNYWDWGPPPDGRSVAILVAGGGWMPPIGGCTVEGRVTNAARVRNDEAGALIEVCRNLPASWTTLWPALRHLD